MPDLNHEIVKCQNHAIDLRKRGYNCAQCVLMSLSKYLDMDEKYAARISAAYGTGFGGSGEMCGAMSILGIAEGLMTKSGEPQDKSAAMWGAKELLDKFKGNNDGRYLCRELKGTDPAKKCPDLIKEAIDLFLRKNPDIIKPKVFFSRLFSSN